MASLKKQSSSLGSYLREEDGKTIKKWLLLASLWLVGSVFLSTSAEAARHYSTADVNHGSSNHTEVNGHVSGAHCSSHANHYNHSSY